MKLSLLLKIVPTFVMLLYAVNRLPELLNKNQPSRKVGGVFSQHPTVGVIKKTLTDKQFTYLLVGVDALEVWIACPQREFVVGHSVSFTAKRVIEAYESQDLMKKKKKMYIAKEIRVV